MSSIDDRIVRLEVQDSEFAKRLEKDEQALKKFSNTIDSVGGSGLASNVQKIADKFSNLGIVGVRTLENIADKAFSTGERLVKSLTVDNIASGWEKLAQQTKAVGTLSIQGFEQSEVDDVIKQLMWYSDETSYNFNDMLTAMTKFTAQSYGLKDSLAVLEGIANWSAVAGQNAAAGSSAMEILSKAVSRGYVGQEQWSSLQTIMMDNKQIRQMILDNAVKMGTLQKVSDTTYKSLSKNIVSSLGASEFNIDQFATYLTTGKWLTSDVLVATMKQYSEAVRPVYEYVEKYNVSAADAIKALNGQLSEQALQFFAAAQEARSLGDALESVRVGSASTWQTTFNTIFGDYEQQKELWTDLSGYLYDLFVESGNRRNALLKEWSEAGGRESFIQSLYNIMDAITKLRDVASEVWNKIFPSKTGQDLLTLTQRFEQFTNKLLNADETFLKIGRVLQGVFSLLKLGKMVISALLEPIKELFGIVDTGSILDIAVAVADAVTNFVHWLEVNDKLHLSLDGIKNVAKTLFGIVGTGLGFIISTASKVATAIKDVAKGGKGLIESFTDVFKKPTKEANKFKKQLDELSDSGAKIVDVPLAYAQKIDKTMSENLGGSLTFVEKLQLGFQGLGNIIKGVYTDVIRPVFTKIGDFLGVTNWFKNGLLPGLMTAFTTLMSFKAVLGITNIIGSIFGAVADVIQGIGGLLGIMGSINQSIKAGALLKAAAAVGILVASLYALTKIDSAALTTAMSNLRDLITDVGLAVQSFTIRSAIALKLLSKINITGVIAAFGVFAAAIWGVNVAMNVFTKMYEALEKAPEDRSKFENALVNFYNSFKDIIDLFKGDNITKVIDYLSMFSAVFSAAAFPIGILRVSSAISKFAKNIKGWFSINNTFKLIQTDTSIPAKILKVAAGIGLIVGALYVLTNLVDQDRLWTGIEALGVIAGGLLVLTGVLSLISRIVAKSQTITDSKNTQKISNAFYDIGKNTWNIAKSVALLAGAAAVLGVITEKMPGAVKKGVEAVGVIALIIGALEFISGKFANSETIGSNLKGVAAAFIGIGLAAAAFAVAIKMLSDLEWEQLRNGLVGVGGSILSVGIAFGIIFAAINGYKLGGTIFALSFAFVAIGWATTFLANAIIMVGQAFDDWKEALGYAGSIAIGLIGMASAIAILGLAITNWKVAVAAFVGIGGIFVLTLIIDRFAESLKKLAEVDPKSVEAMSTAIGIMAGAFAAVAIALGMLAPELAAATPAVPVLLSIAAVVASIGVAMWGAAELTDAFVDALIRLDEFVANPKSGFGANIAKFLEAIARPIGYIAEALNWILDTAEGIGEAIGNWMGGKGFKANSRRKDIFANLGVAGVSLLTGNAGGLVDSITNIYNDVGNKSGEAYSDGVVKAVRAGANQVGDVLVTTTRGQGHRANAAMNQNGSELVTIAHSYQETIANTTDQTIADIQTKAVDGAAKTNTSLWDKFTSLFKSSSDSIIPGLGSYSAEDMTKYFTETASQIMPDWMADMFKDLQSDEYLNYAASNTGSWLGLVTAQGYSESLKKAVGQTMIVVNDFFAKNFSLPTNLTDRTTASIKKASVQSYALSKATEQAAANGDSFAKIANGINSIANNADRARNSISSMSTKTANSMMIADSSIEKLYRDIDAIFAQVSNNAITPVIDTSNWDLGIDKMANDLNSLYSGALGKDDSTLTDKLEKQVNDWELSTEELIRKYSTLSTSVDAKTGQIYRYWTYNGPMGGEVIPDEVEWVYEGPRSGIYDIAEDRYLFEVKGHVEDIANWNAQWQDIYFGYAEYQNESLDSINTNTQQLNSSILDQTALQELYNQQMQDQLSSISSQLGDLNTNVTGLGNDFSNFGVYLDGKTLVGQLTDQIDQSLGNKQALVSRGVKR